MEEEKNISCNIFLEQLQLINQLPLEDRGNVLYMAILKAFINQDVGQLEKQLEHTYISISKSISLSILSNTVLNLLNKTVVCKKYNKNWGGKRIGSGKPKLVPINKNKTPSKDDIRSECKIQGRNIDVDAFFDYWDKANWCDKSGLPINWKQKIVTWAMRETNEPKKRVSDGLF